MSEEVYPIKIVIADGSPISRRDLRQSLESEPDVCVPGEVSSAEGIAEVAKREAPDVILIDFVLAQKADLRTLSVRATATMSPRIVIMLPSVEKVHLVEAFRLGAHGVVHKRSSPHDLLNSIRCVMRGQYWVESQSVGVLVEALRESLAMSNGAKTPKDYGLTRREVDIIAKIVSGRSNKEVSEEFAISERTVKHHLTNIFSKVGVSNRLQLALFAVNQHLANTTQRSLSLQSAVQPDQSV